MSIFKGLLNLGAKTLLGSKIRDINGLIEKAQKQQLTERDTVVADGLLDKKFINLFLKLRKEDQVSSLLIARKFIETDCLGNFPEFLVENADATLLKGIAKAYLSNPD